MNKVAETKTLAIQVKDALKGAQKCVIEIHSPLNNPAGKRLLKSLSVAGVKANLIQVVDTPHTGILIETCPDCAGVGLAIQSAFRVAAVEAHLLVQNVRIPNTVVIHLNSLEDPKAPK
ncbi:MAG TPA: hypothetical protein VM680_13560 [Verrucomicrobiae bacterium]|nr:hypothetical protein [Verrucomicrobiae bacterium]